MLFLYFVKTNVGVLMMSFLIMPKGTGCVVDKLQYIEQKHCFWEQNLKITTLLMHFLHSCKPTLWKGNANQVFQIWKYTFCICWEGVTSINIFVSWSCNLKIDSLREPTKMSSLLPKNLHSSKELDSCQIDTLVFPKSSVSLVIH